MKILPKDVPQLSFKKKLMFDVDLYDIDETYRLVRYNGMMLNLCVGQVALREMLNANYRIRENPWCILKNDLDPKSVMFGKLSLLAIWSWSHYSLFPKVAAFRNNKLIAIKHSSHTNPEFIWWDRHNFPFRGCPILQNGTTIEVDDANNTVIR